MGEAAAINIGPFPVAAAELVRFVRESNAIEGITRRPLKRELIATEIFLALMSPRLIDLEGLVGAYQPDAILRRTSDLNVRVGRHIAPRGGLYVVAETEAILATLPASDPWGTHVRYETLHPFTDGNGRSGRALWAWQMARRQQGLPLGFLHQWYYGTLERARI